MEFFDLGLYMRFMGILKQKLLIFQKLKGDKSLRGYDMTPPLENDSRDHFWGQIDL